MSSFEEVLCHPVQAAQVSSQSDDACLYMHHLVGKNLLIKKIATAIEICGILVISSSTSQHDQNFLVMAP